MNAIPYHRGDRIALVRTNDTCTRLQPGDTGTVTGCDSALDQFSDRQARRRAFELRLYVADMSATRRSSYPDLSGRQPS